MANETTSRAAAQPIWNPSRERVRGSRMWQFLELLNARHGAGCTDYASLHAWSVEHLETFWREVWDFVGVRATRPFQSVVDDARRMPGADWFRGAELNFAENLLRRDDDGAAIRFRGETMHATRVVSWRELRGMVAATAEALRRLGVEPGDRVVGFMPNLPETIVAMLAATSLGAIWSSCSPDFGVKGVLDRFGGIDPKVLFCANGYSYGGKPFDCMPKVSEVVGGLARAPHVIVVPYIGQRPDLSSFASAAHHDDLLAEHAGAELRFTPVPADHPLYIMYSSGTTGLPKCIVQSTAGVLVNQLKELVLHNDLGPGDNIFYFTTCGWMMWNWLVCALGTGATVTLFDGSPFHPDASALWRLAAAEGVTVFGTSAKYIAALEKAGARPRDHFDLARVRAVLSTGSPLAEESFDYVYDAIGDDLQLASISGGTDLNGCFVAGNPLAPVYRGEIQGPCLGMDVHAYDADGHRVVGAMGELVCEQAFPSMPLFFWGDEDGSRYRSSYFERFPGVWCHGDFLEINDHGGVRITGRSDATLNPGGVRIGTAEIYRQVEPMEEIEDSIVIGQDHGDDQRVILFVKMRAGEALTNELVKRIKTAIRSGCSPRHVPAKVIAVPDIPYTISGKKVELAVRDVVHGRVVKNRDALRNPEALEGFAGVIDD